MAEPKKEGADFSGVLLEHGAAPYEHDSVKEQSHFARVRTAGGDVTLWGVDLQRAIREAGVQPGDEVRFARTGSEAVSVTVRDRDSQGRQTGSHDILARRNRWKVERIVQRAGEHIPQEERHEPRQKLGMAQSANGSGSQFGATVGESAGGSIEDASREPHRSHRIGPAQADSLDWEGEEQAGSAQNDSQAPEAALWQRIRRQYIISRQGEYRLLAQPHRVAFRDSGPKLVTEFDDAQVVRGMLDVAEHKGWSRVNLAGSETFRRLAWLEAGVRGIETSGFTPSLDDRQRLSEWLAERASAPSRVGGVGRAPGVGLGSGANNWADARGANRGEVQAQVQRERDLPLEVALDKDARGVTLTRAGFRRPVQNTGAAQSATDAREVVLAQRVPVLSLAEELALRAAGTEARREEVREEAYRRYVREGLVIRAMTDDEILRYRSELDAGRAERAKAVMREAAERQKGTARSMDQAPADSVVVKEEPVAAFAAAVAEAKAGRAPAEDRDAVVLAVADAVLRERRVRETTRARVAAAITRRLAVLREQGTSVSVLMYDRSAKPATAQPVEVARSRAIHARAR